MTGVVGGDAGASALAGPRGTVGALIRAATARLDAAGLPTPWLDARLLVQHALGLDRTDLLVARDRPVAVVDWTVVENLVDRRIDREPVSHILGRREFWSLPFRVSPAVLDPRPDSETLVTALLERLVDRRRPWRLLDLGTGSGCLLLALLSELPGATGLGIDLSHAAARVAADNARRLGLADRARIAVGHWADSIRPGFDAVVCNPPYVRRSDLAVLQPEVVRFEPHLALDGGPDGLDAYRTLARPVARVLAPGGWAAFEIGAGQAEMVPPLLAGQGLAICSLIRDFGAVPRCVIARRPTENAE